MKTYQPTDKCPDVPLVSEAVVVSGAFADPNDRRRNPDGEGHGCQENGVEAAQRTVAESCTKMVQADHLLVQSLLLVKRCTTTP